MPLNPEDPGAPGGGAPENIAHNCGLWAVFQIGRPGRRGWPPGGAWGATPPLATAPPLALTAPGAAGDGLGAIPGGMPLNPEGPWPRPAGVLAGVGVRN